MFWFKYLQVVIQKRRSFCTLPPHRFPRIYLLQPNLSNRLAVGSKRLHPYLFLQRRLVKLDWHSLSSSATACSSFRSLSPSALARLQPLSASLQSRERKTQAIMQVTRQCILAIRPPTRDAIVRISVSQQKAALARCSRCLRTGSVRTV